MNNEIITLYHNCPKSALNNILKFGIRKSYAVNKNNLTHKEISDKTDKIPKVVYLGNKRMADGVGAYRKNHGYSDDEGVTLLINIPKEEYNKLKIIDNPECLGAKSLSEYIEIRKKLNSKDKEEDIKQRWKVINPPYTITIADDISPKYILSKFKNGGKMKATELTINNLKYKVLIAESLEDKTNGLKGVEKLPEGKGMLFVWDKPQKVSMTMLDTVIPLDLIFIDEDGEVLKVVHRPDTELNILEDCENTQFVLELNINSTVEEGDYVDGLPERESDSQELPLMKILDSKGDVLYTLEGGERIFSRKSTKRMIKWAKRAYMSNSDGDYKRLGTTVIKELHALDNRDPEYVEAPK